MKLGFLALPEDERRLYIEQAAALLSLSPVMLEKDFWVCWLLGILFKSEFAGKRAVKLEFGSLTDQQPIGLHPVRPWVAEVLPASFADWKCEVVSLEVERSFWEKATILHTEYHRPADKPTPDRFSRHYADTAALAKHPTAGKAVEDHPLRRRVVKWKRQFFGSSWANYDQAKPGTFRLVPPSERLPSLRRDYRAMRDMYLSEPVSFDDILATLTELEKRINGIAEG